MKITIRRTSKTSTLTLWLGVRQWQRMDQRPTGLIIMPLWEIHSKVEQLIATITLNLLKNFLKSKRSLQPHLQVICLLKPNSLRSVATSKSFSTMTKFCTWVAQIAVRRWSQKTNFGAVKTATNCMKTISQRICFQLWSVMCLETSWSSFPGSSETRSWMEYLLLNSLPKKKTTKTKINWRNFCTSARLK